MTDLDAYRERIGVAGRLAADLPTLRALHTAHMRTIPSPEPRAPSLEPHELADFAETCRFQQTSPDSLFVGGWVCSIATAHGGTTLAGRHYVASDGEARDERELTSAS